MLLAAAPLAGATATWTGAVNGDWNTAGNWSPSGVPDATVDVVFDASAGQRVVALVAGMTAKSLTFAGSNDDWLVWGGSLTVSGPITADRSAIIASNLTLGAASTWTIAAGRRLAVSGTWNQNGQTLALVLGGSGAQVEHAGALSVSAVTASADWAKLGAGVLTITGDQRSTWTAGTLSAGQGSVVCDLGGLADPTTGQFAAGVGVVANGGAVQVLGKNGVASAQTVNGLSVGSGGSTMTATRSGGAAMGLSLGALTRAAGYGTLNVAGDGAPTTSTANLRGLIGPWATFSGSDYVKNDGSGNLVALGTAGATAESGWASANANYNLSANADLTAARSAGTLRSTAGGLAIDLKGYALTADGILSSTGTLTLRDTVGGGSLAGANGSEVVLTGPGNLTLSNPLVAAAQQITKGGSGTLTLNVANACNGNPLTIDGGAVSVPVADGLGGAVAIRAGATLTGSVADALRAASIDLDRGGALSVTASYAARNATVRVRDGATFSPGVDRACDGGTITVDSGGLLTPAAVAGALRTATVRMEGGRLHQVYHDWFGVDLGCDMRVISDSLVIVQGTYGSLESNGTPCTLASLAFATPGTRLRVRRHPSSTAWPKLSCTTVPLTVSGILDVDGGSFDVRWGTVTGSGSVVVGKEGNGNMWLTAADSAFAGGYDVSAGTLRLTAARCLGSGTSTVRASGQISTQDQVADALSGARVRVQTGGTLSCATSTNVGSFGLRDGSIDLEGGTIFVTHHYWGSNNGGQIRLLAPSFLRFNQIYGSNTSGQFQSLTFDQAGAGLRVSTDVLSSTGVQTATFPTVALNADGTLEIDDFLPGPNGGATPAVQFGAITGASTLTRLGAGPFTLASASPGFTGAMRLQAGSTALNASLSSATLVLAGGTLTSASAGNTINGFVFNSGTLSNPITIASGGFLGGIGTIDSTTLGRLTRTTCGVKPGDPTGTTVGTLTVAGNLTLGGASVCEISGDAANDRLSLSSGTLIYGGTLTVTFSGYTPSTPQTWTLFSAPTLMGTFTSITLPSPPAGLVWHDYGGGVYFQASTGQVSLEAASEWVGGQPGDLWASAGNWSPAAVPDSTLLAVFGDLGWAAHRTVTLGVAVSKGLYFQGSNDGYLLTGGTLDLHGSVVADRSASLASTLALQADSGWVVASGKTLAVTGAINGSGHILTKTGSGTVSFTGASVRTLGTLTMSAGSLVVGPNTSVGTVDLSAGSGVLDASTALAISGNLKLADSTATYSAGGGPATFSASGSNLGVDAGATPRILGLGGGSLVVSTLPAPPLDLTGMPAAAAAYGLRKLRAGYSGPAIQASNAAGTVTQDIGFTALGDLDTTALLVFAAANGGNAYVRIWYDQSGNGRAVTQTATAANMPLIVSANVVNTVNGRPMVRFDGSNDNLFLTSTFADRSGILPLSVNLVAKFDTVSGYRGFIGNRSAGTLNWYLYEHLTGATVQMHGSAQFKGAWTPNNTSTYLLTGIINGSSSLTSTLYESSSSAMGTVRGTTIGYTYGGTAGIFCLSGYNNGSEVWSGQMGEALVFLSDLGASRSFLETNQATCYGLSGLSWSNTGLALSASASLDLGSQTCDHTLGLLSLAAGSTLTLRSGRLVTFSGACTWAGAAGIAAGSPAPTGLTLTGLSSSGLGTLSCGVPLTLSGTTTMRLDGAGSDRIAVTSGTLTYGGTLTLSIINPPTTAAQTYTLFTGSMSGGFTFTPPTPPAGYQWHDFGGGVYLQGGQVQLDAISLEVNLATPVDNAGHTLNPRPALVWYVPYASSGNVDFLVTVDGSQVADSAASSTGFEYFNGTAWVAWTGAVAAAALPNDLTRKVRWRPTAADLSVATHTWRIQAKIGAGTGPLSTQRSFTIANPPWATDIVVGEPIRAVHLTDLRTEAAAARAFRGLAAATWTDAITARATRIRKAHLEDLRTALTAVFAEAGYVQHAGRDPSITPATEAGFYGEEIVPNQTAVRSLHFQRMRDALRGF